MKFRLYKTIVFTTLLSIYKVLAQTDSNLIVTNFDKNHFTEVVNGKLNFGFNDEKFSTKILDDYFSSQILSGNKTIRSENKFFSDLKYQILETTNLQIIGNSFILSDNQNFVNNKTGWHNIFFGANYNLKNDFYFSPFIGIRQEKQIAKEDNGLANKIIFKSGNYETTDGNFSSSIDLENSKLGDRKFWNKNGELNYLKNFGGGSVDSSTYKWSSNRWDFYFPSDDLILNEFGEDFNIRQRMENKSQIYNNLKFTISENINSIIDFGYKTEKISNSFKYKLPNQKNYFDTDVKREQFEILTALNFSNSKIKSTVQLKYNEKNETHETIKNNYIDKTSFEEALKQESKLNNIARLTNLFLMFEGEVFKKSYFTIEFGSQILKYDTPDSTNVEDRDEFGGNLSIGIKQKFNQNFETGFGTDLILHHLVYLFSERSANNNWNRLIRLWGEVSGRGENFSNKFRGEILANYTVFDFETKIPSVKSFIYRELNWKDSTLIKIYKNNWINFFGEFRLYERGDLKWDEFKEIPIQYFEEISINPSLSILQNVDYKILVGMRIFSQTRYQFEKLEKKLDEKFLSYGPVLNLNYFFGNGSSLNFRFWGEIQTSSNGYEQKFSNGNLEFRWRL